jgi:hypothetical protein
VSGVDLVTFLRARLDEREAAAKAAGGDSWVAEPRTYGSYAVACDGEPVVYDEGAPTEAQATHIALNDPAYVLDDVAAKRRIVDEAERYSPELEHGDNGEWALDMVLRLLAAPFVSHPDFDPAWASGEVTAMGGD